MMDPSARRVDYLDLATPQSSRSSPAMHRAGQRAPSPTHSHRPHAPLSFADDTLLPRPPRRALSMRSDAAPGYVGHQIAPFRRRQIKRPGVREHDREVFQVALRHCYQQGTIHPVFSSLQVPQTCTS